MYIKYLYPYHFSVYINLQMRYNDVSLSGEICPKFSRAEPNFANALFWLSENFVCPRNFGALLDLIAGTIKLARKRKDRQKLLVGTSCWPQFQFQDISCISVTINLDKSLSPFPFQGENLVYFHIFHI